MGFDLCSLEVARVRARRRSDQSGAVAEGRWPGGARHLACINGQTSTGRLQQDMHTFMRGIKMHITQRVFFLLSFFSFF